MALFGLAIACSAAPTSTPIVFDDPLPFDPGPDVGGRALQQEIFADGEVTSDEYERAVTATVQCIRDEGFGVDGPLRYPEGYTVTVPGYDPSLWLLYRIDAGDDPQDRAGDVDGRCQAQWSFAVQAVYTRQFEPTEEEIRAWLQRAWDCAKEKGLPLSSPPTVQEATDVVAFDCRPWLSE
jgi:hypothetical protein